MAKKTRRRRTTSEKVMLVFGIIIALSMILSLIVGLGPSSSGTNAPLPIETIPDEQPGEQVVPVGAIEMDEATVATLGATGPPTF